VENGKVIEVTEIPTRGQRTNPCPQLIRLRKLQKRMTRTIVINRLVGMDLRISEGYAPVRR